MHQHTDHTPIPAAPPPSRSHALRLLGLLGPLVLAIVLLAPVLAEAVCPKKPILESMLTDVCWSCIFPFKIGDVDILTLGMKDTCAPGDPTCKLNKTICFCDDSVLPGVTVSFWEPIRLMEIVREPYCFPSLNGLQLDADTIRHAGHYSDNLQGSIKDTAFYQVHYIAFPVWQLIGLTVALTTDLMNSYTLGLFPDLSKCFSVGGFDTADLDFLYLTELDPLWNDDELGLLLNPEAVLFANPIAQAVCAADCVAATAGYPIDPLFWCAGCWGSLYPFGGTVAGPVGEPNTAALVAARALAKFNREFLEALTTTKAALCGKQFTGFIRKSQYKLQMIYPVPSTKAAQEELTTDAGPDTDSPDMTPKPFCCLPLGRSALLWDSFRSFPVKGEDFVWLVFRKKDCCAR